MASTTGIIKVGSPVYVKGKEEIYGVLTVKWKGKPTFGTGNWVGLELDEEHKNLGKNDGSVKGTRYFKTEPLQGIFVKEDMVTLAKKTKKTTSTIPKTIQEKEPTKTPSKENLSTSSKENLSTSNKEKIEESSEKESSEKESSEKESSEKEYSKIEPSKKESSKKEPSKKVNLKVETEPILKTPPSQSKERTEKVDQLLDTINQLQLEKAKLNENIRNLTTQNKELTIEKKKLKESKEEIIKESKKELETQIKILEKKMNQMEKNFKEEKEKLESELNTVSENLEMMTLDKEIAEEKSETLELELENLKQQVELNQMEKKIQEEEKKMNEENLNNSQDVTVLKNQNEQLKETLMKMRDLIVKEKQEFEKKNNNLEKSVKEGQIFHERLQKKEKDFEQLSNELEQTKEALDTALESEQMVERLSEKILNLEDKLRESEQAIEELEEMKEISEEMEESQSFEIKQLASQNYAKEIKILDFISQNTVLEKRLKDQQKTIDQFRNVVKTQQEDLSILRKKEQEIQMETSQLESQTQTLQNQNFQMHSQSIKKSIFLIEKNLSDLKSKQMKDQTNFLKDYLPENILNRDFRCLELNLLLKRFCLKSEIIISYADQYQMDIKLISSHSEILFYTKVKEILTKIEWKSQDILHFMETTSSEENYLNLGNFFSQIQNFEPFLDDILDQIKEDNFSPNYSLVNLNNYYESLENISKNVDYEQETQEKKYRIVFKINLQLEFLILDIAKLKFLGSRFEKSEHLLNFLKQLPFDEILNLGSSAKKVLNSVKLYAPQPKQSQSFFQILHKIEKSLNEINQKIQKILNNIENLSEENPSSRISQILDEFKNFNSEKSILETLEKNFFQISEILLVGTSVSQNKEKNENLKNEHNSLLIYVKRAAEMRRILADAFVIKEKLDEKQNEINALKLTIQQQQNKNNDLSYDIQSLNRKIDRIDKDNEILRSQLAETIQDRSALKKKNQELLENISIQQEKIKKWNFDQKKYDAKRFESQNSKHLESAIQFLKLQNSKLNSAQSLKELQELPELPDFRKPLSISFSKKLPNIIKNMTVINLQDFQKK